MGALGDGIHPDADHAHRLCQLLGLDPNETTEIRVVIEAGTGAVVEWTGKRRVPLAKIATAFADVFDDPDPAPARPGGMSEWSIGADPFTGPQVGVGAVDGRCTCVALECLRPGSAECAYGGPPC